jgi:hypothetical protein
MREPVPGLTLPVIPHPASLQAYVRSAVAPTTDSEESMLIEADTLRGSEADGRSAEGELKGHMSALERVAGVHVGGAYWRSSVHGQ